MDRKTALERAFELAAEGYTTPDIRTILHREGYDVRQIYGPAITEQLNERSHAARGEAYKGRGGRRKVAAETNNSGAGSQISRSGK